MAPSATELLGSVAAQAPPEPAAVPASPDTTATGLLVESGNTPAAARTMVSSDPQRKETALEVVLNTLGIPNNAMAGAVQALLDGENPFWGMSQGVKRHTTFGKVLADEGLSGPLAGILGFALDVGLDPTTYLGLGGLTKAGAAARAATYGMKSATLAGDAAEAARFAAQVARTGMFGMSAAEQARLGQRALVTFGGRAVLPRSMSAAVMRQSGRLGAAMRGSEVGTSLRQMFSTLAERVEEPLRASAFATRARVQAETRRSVEKFLTPAQKTVKRLAEEAGVDYRMAAAMVAEATQLARDPMDVLTAIRKAKVMYGGTASLDDAALAEVVNSINAANTFAITAEKAAGLRISELVGAQNYLKRAITPEGVDAIRKSNRAFRGLTAREFATDFGAQIQRDPQLRDLTIREINDLGRQGKLAVTGGVPVREFFHEDPFIATARRLNESADAIASREFLESAGKVYGAWGAAPMGWRAVRGKASEGLNWQRFKQVGKKQVLDDELKFAPEVADLLETNYERMVTPQFLYPFLRVFDQLQGGFKAWTLSIWPSYHTRNGISDLWMVTAIPGGMPLWRAPQRVSQAIQALTGRSGSIRLSGHNYTWSQLRDLAETVGTTRVGVGREVQELIHQPLMRERMGTLDVLTDNRFVRVGLAAGAAREDALRMAYFIERLARGETPQMAALEVKKRLFDYSELTSFEKQVMRRVFPFYSWSRHNIPLQLEWMLRRPGYGATFQKLREETGVAFGAREPSQGAAPLPRFLARGVPIPVGTTRGGEARFLRTQNIVPTGDVQQVFNPAQTILDQLTPLVKAPIEVAWNADLFRGGKLENFPGEKTTYLGLPVNRRISPLVDLYRPIPEASRLLGPTQPGMPTTGVGERLANFLMARTYGVNPLQQMQREQQDIEAALRDYQFRLNMAIRRGDTVNAEALQRAIQDLIADPHGHMPNRR